MRSEKLDQLTYIIKVSVGLVVVFAAVLVSLLSTQFHLAGSLHWGLMGFLIGFFALIPPVSYAIYLKMDELQKKLHAHAGVTALTLMISVAGMIGVLQAGEFIPLFNQFWFLAIGIAVWGIALVFYDHFYK